MLRLVMSLLILRRVWHHKSTYQAMVRALYGDWARGSLLLRPSTRDRLVAYLVAVDAWHMVFFGRHLKDMRSSFLLSSMAVCYDDAIDRQGFRDLASLEAFLEAVPDTADGLDHSTAVGCGKASLIALKRTDPAFFHRAHKHLLAINRATQESFLQDPPDEESLRRSCHDKGGHSFMLFALAGTLEATEKDLRLAYRSGAACQLADDIYDRKEDQSQGQMTLALAGLLGDGDRQILRHLTQELPPYAELGPRAFREAWRGYHHDALELYDSGKLGGGWQHDLGQRVFKLGLALIPALPRK